MLRAFLCSALLLPAVVASPVFAREWKDSTGSYSVDAELVAFSDHEVVLKREDGKLVSLQRSQLSEGDRRFLETRGAETVGRDAPNKPPTWTMKGGWRITGRPVGYGRKEVVIQRRRGKVYVNDRVLTNLPEVYQRMLPRIVSHFEEVQLDNTKGLVEWAVKQKGRPKKFTIDGVVLELENGDELAVPFIFFSEEDLEVLRPGWERWLASYDNVDRREREDFLLQAQARAYRQDQRIRQQIAAMQLMFSAVEAGVTDLWEVYLQPKAGVAAIPQLVVVPARDSRQAILLALEKFPGYVAGPARKLN